MPSIDDSIETVDATSAILRTLKSRIDRQLVKLAHRRNSLQPINIIPEEISVAIFHRAVAGLIPWRDSDVNALWVLARVQTYWWHLIKNHASFWTDIQARSSPHANRFKLRNSQNAPLTIRYKREDPADGIPQFIDGIALQTHRWKSLVWTGPFLDMLLEYLERPLPMLEHLDLAYQPEEIGGVPILNVQVIGGPRLRTVHTKSLSLPFAQLTTLVDLAIEDLPDSALLPSTLIDILLACTNLQNLKLDCISSSALAAPNLECGLVNSLSLKVLYLDNTSSAVITTLLRCIPVEKLGELTVAFRTSDSEDNTIVPPPTADLQAGAGEILDQLLQPRVSGSSTLYILLDRSSIQQVKIFIEPWAFTILFTVTGEQETWLRLEGVPLRRTLRGLASLPLAIHRVELFYEAPDDDVGEKIDSTFFEAYPNVVKFGFICPNQLIVQIFRWLSEQEVAGIQIRHRASYPRTAPSGGTTHPCT